MKAQDKFLNGQEVSELLYQNPDGNSACGMSVRIYGGTYEDLRDRSDRREIYPAFMDANKLIDDGKIFYVEPFKCEEKSCHGRFQYGGGWACNDCGTCIDEPKWWRIKVFADGDEFCCVGDGFKDLQESNNYAFGKTKEEAKESYRKLFI